MKYKIHTVVKFETAHRQLGDASKCGFLHGHNWKAEIIITSSKLSQLGYIIDFKVIKDVITNTLDHKVILNNEDPLAAELLENHNQKVYALNHTNPTCEILAEYILKLIKMVLDDEHSEVIVRLYENDESYAEVSYPESI